MVFIIGFNQFSKIITSQKQIEHAIYAEDAVTFTKIKDNNKVKVKSYSQIFKKILTGVLYQVPNSQLKIAVLYTPVIKPPATYLISNTKI